MAYLEMKESCEFIFHLQVSAGCGTQYQQLSLHSQLPLTSAVLDHFTKYAKKDRDYRKSAIVDSSDFFRYLMLSCQSHRVFTHICIFFIGILLAGYV